MAERSGEATSRRPAARWRPRRTDAPLLGLGAIVAVATALAIYYGLRTHWAQPDEYLTIIYGRSVESQPDVLLHYSSWPRGPERLTAAVFAIVSALFSSTPATFAAAHVVFAICFAITAVPVYALGRLVGLDRRWALVPAALSVIGPWSVFGISLLNTGLGYLTTALLLLAMLRAVLGPGLAADLWLIAALVATALARTGDIPFVFALVPAVAVQIWRDRPARQSLRAFAASLPGVLLRRHPLLTPLAAAGVVAALALDAHRYTGVQYQTPIVRSFTFDGLWNDTLDILARLTTGTLIVPFVVAAPWLVRDAVRPGTRERGAFAMVALGFLAAFIYFYAGRNEDRYTVVLAPIVFIPFVAVLARRPTWSMVPALGATLLSGLLVGRLLVTRGLFSDDGSYGFFVSPGTQFVRRVVVGRLQALLPLGGHGGTVVAVGAVVVALALVAASIDRRPAARIALVAGVAGIMGLAAAAAVYSPHRLLALASPKVSFAQQAFVDETAGGRAVPLLDENPGGDTALVRAWGELSFFNQSVRGTVRPDAKMTIDCCSPYYARPVIAALDRRSGGVRTDRPIGDLIVVPTGFTSFGFNTTTVRRTPAFPMRLERFDNGPPRIAYAVSGTEPDGWGRPGKAVRVRTFPRSIRAPRACLRLMANPAPVPSGPITVRARGAEGTVSVRLAPGVPQPMMIPLGDRAVDVVRVHAGPAGQTLDGRDVTASLTDLQVVPCQAG